MTAAEVAPTSQLSPGTVLGDRFEIVGPLVPGAKYTLPTMVSDEGETIVVRILDAAERESHKAFPNGGHLCRVEVGRDIFGTVGGAIFVWFDEAGKPGRTVVEDVLALGNVTGTLRGLKPRPAVGKDTGHRNQGAEN